MILLVHKDTSFTDVLQTGVTSKIHVRVLTVVTVALVSSGLDETMLQRSGWVFTFSEEAGRARDPLGQGGVYNFNGIPIGLRCLLE